MASSGAAASHASSAPMVAVPQGGMMTYQNQQQVPAGYMMCMMPVNCVINDGNGMAAPMWAMGLPAGSAAPSAPQSALPAAGQLTQEEQQRPRNAEASAKPLATPSQGEVKADAKRPRTLLQNARLPRRGAAAAVAGEEATATAEATVASGAGAAPAEATWAAAPSARVQEFLAGTGVNAAHFRANRSTINALNLECWSSQLPKKPATSAWVPQRSRPPAPAQERLARLTQEEGDAAKRREEEERRLAEERERARRAEKEEEDARRRAEEERRLAKQREQAERAEKERLARLKQEEEANRRAEEERRLEEEREQAARAKEKEEEAKPLSALEFPTLGAAVKGKKGPPVKASVKRAAEERARKAAEEETARAAEEARVAAEVARAAAEARVVAEAAEAAEAAKAAKAAAEEAALREAEELARKAAEEEAARAAEEARLAAEEAARATEEAAVDVAEETCSLPIKGGKSKKNKETAWGSLLKNIGEAGSTVQTPPLLDAAVPACTPSTSEGEAELEEGSTSHRSSSSRGASRPPSPQSLPNCDDLMNLRSFILGYRVLGTDIPESVATFFARETEGAYRSESPGSQAPADAPSRAQFGTRIQRDRRESRGDFVRPAALALPEPSENAYRMTPANRQVSREDELNRCVKGLLNKVCPDNVHVIAERILNEAQVATVRELEIVIKSIFKKALAEPHYCETYADLVYNLKSHLPSFQSAEEGGKLVTFKSTLLNVCQAEFESMPTSLIISAEEAESCSKEELDLRRGQQKARFLANMRFIGNLFLRQLLTARIISCIIRDLTLGNGVTETFPEEHVIECICELLSAIGYTLDSIPAGSVALSEVLRRLADLCQHKQKTGKGTYSKRIQFKIQEVLEMRTAGWIKRNFKATAKTKEEIRLEQERHIRAKESGYGDQGFAETVVAGQRPAYLTESASGKDTATSAEWQDVAKCRPVRR